LSASKGPEKEEENAEKRLNNGPTRENPAATTRAGRGGGSRRKVARKKTQYFQVPKGKENEKAY